MLVVLKELDGEKLCYAAIVLYYSGKIECLFYISFAFIKTFFMLTVLISNAAMPSLFISAI